VRHGGAGRVSIPTASYRSRSIVMVAAVMETSWRVPANGYLPKAPIGPLSRTKLAATDRFAVHQDRPVVCGLGDAASGGVWPM
jgi:hypothetical protein